VCEIELVIGGAAELVPKQINNPLILNLV